MVPGRALAVLLVRLRLGARAGARAAAAVVQSAIKCFALRRIARKEIRDTAVQEDVDGRPAAVNAMSTVIMDITSKEERDDASGEVGSMIHRDVCRIRATLHPSCMEVRGHVITTCPMERIAITIAGMVSPPTQADDARSVCVELAFSLGTLLLVFVLRARLRSSRSDSHPSTVLRVCSSLLVGPL